MSGSEDDNEFLRSFESARTRSALEIENDINATRKLKYTYLLGDFAIELFREIYFEDQNDQKQGFVKLGSGNQLDEESFLKKDRLYEFIYTIIGHNENLLGVHKGTNTYFTKDNISPAILAAATIYLIRLLVTDLAEIRKLRARMGQHDEQHVKGFCALLMSVLILLAAKMIDDVHLNNVQLDGLLQYKNQQLFGLPKNDDLITNINALEEMILDALEFNMSTKVNDVVDPGIALELMLAPSAAQVPAEIKRNAQSNIDAVLAGLNHKLDLPETRRATEDLEPTTPPPRPRKNSV